ncbi:hypothetical protein [Flavobacterium sp. UBA4197]|uniref:hypothetical protein n=1 Tax=Flavobacterium sp. UBA4197 TaxID=1946546 RepID=UPI00257C0CA9|nr:hypothetical protein [Flavobacterium sp. UBA4197]
MENRYKAFNDLINIMLDQAKVFLGELGEFFPYGSVLTADCTIETLGIINDDDPDFNAEKAISVFSDKIVKEIENDKILIGAIGIDVLLKESGQNAIMIKATDDGIKWHEIFRKINSNYGTNIRSRDSIAF